MSVNLFLDYLSPKQHKELITQITASLSQKQGFRIGESTVVSHYLHSINPLHPEEIRILMNRDVGQVTAHHKDPGQVIHVDTYHEPALVDIRSLTLAIARTVRTYLNIYYKGKDIEPHLRSYFGRIAFRTGETSESLKDALSTHKEKTDTEQKDQKKNSHVHLLITELAPEHYCLILCLVDTIETELARQKIEIRKIDNIYHVEKRQQMDQLSYLGLEPDEYRLWNMSMSLSTILSGADDVIEFLQTFQPGPFRRKKPLSNLRNRNGNLRGLILGAAEAGIIKRGWFADTLTKEGQSLLSFMTEHQHELEAQLRRMIRKLPVPRGKFRSVSNTRLKNRQKHYTYNSKSTTSMEDSWMGSIAVPETVMNAAKNSLLEKRPSFRITQDDIRVHKKEFSQPVDMCLVLDGSASMIGPKTKAIKYLVEHLFLVTRDKIAVVVFQGREARVAVPFTRNYTRLKAGIKSLQPQGLTPLADGIYKSIKLIKNRQVRNPLLILITDGMPTTGKWTINPQQDALRAADMINETKAKLLCIGVASNQEFLEELAEKAKGSVYIMDSLDDSATLIEIIHRERKIIQS
ncbi:MAG: VWA domain-containing protein [Syntrophaceticus sp.]|nr:VWA domain-containing protein [Syntrophaceticus sp.]